MAESSDEDEGVPGLVDSSSTSDAVYSSTDDSSTDNEQ